MTTHSHLEESVCVKGFACLRVISFVFLECNQGWRTEQQESGSRKDRDVFDMQAGIYSDFQIHEDHTFALL